MTCVCVRECLKFKVKPNRPLPTGYYTQLCVKMIDCEHIPESIDQLIAGHCMQLITTYETKASCNQLIDIFRYDCAHNYVIRCYTSNNAITTQCVLMRLGGL